MASNDPLVMGDLEPASIAAQVETKSRSKIKPPSELDLAKEERLQQREKRLTSQPAKAFKEPSVKPEPTDPSQLLDKIAAYKERFTHLKSRNPKLSAKSSIEEITDELHYIELQLGSSKDGSLGNMIFIGSMVGLETLTQRYNPMNLNLQGLGQIAKDNVGEFSPIIDELMIKYGAGFYVSPEYRLVMAVGALVMTVHSANSGDSRVGDALKKMGATAKPPVGSDTL